MNDNVWLSVLTATKLELRWEGGWKVTSVKSPVTVEMSNGNQTRVVHSNRLQHYILPVADSVESALTEGTTEETI